MAHLSNALGTVLPVRRIAELAHARGIPVFVDGAQAAPRMPVDVRALDVDFYAFSSHKIYGPTGVGVLYGKAALLDAMPPYQGGGDMIRSVTFEKTTFNDLPYKFEAGTPNIAGGIAFGAALDYVNGLGLAGDRRARARPARLRDGVALRDPGPDGSSARPARRPGCCPSCSTASTRTTSARCSTAKGSPIRTGHHCAQPVMDRFGLPATARASFGLYNTREEVDALVARDPQSHRDVPLMSELRDLYQEVILDHSKRPRNFHAIADASRKAEGYNPLCGDRETVYLVLEGDA